MKTRRPQRPSRPQRRGFTLIELLVVISIIAVLMSLILPAVQQAREAGRRTQCMNNQKNIALGAIAYATARRGKLPASGYYGLVTASTPSLYPQRSWVVELLPNLDQGPLADRWRRDALWNDTTAPKADLTNAAIGQTNIGALTCPDDDSAFAQNGGLSYVANNGFGDTSVIVDLTLSNGFASLGHHPLAEPFNWVTVANGDPNGSVGDGAPSQEIDVVITRDTGVFWPSADVPQIPNADYSANIGTIPDGASNTIMFSENVNAGITSWANPDIRSGSFIVPLDSNGVSGALFGAAEQMAAAGIPWRLNAAKIGPEGTSPYPNSNHPGVIVMAFCDGTVRPIAETIDTNVYTRLVTPGGSKLRSFGGFKEEIPISENSF
jgi:prepilin-type N-terminal cleavage/methylation domain-containing protein